MPPAIIGAAIALGASAAAAAGIIAATTALVIGMAAVAAGSLLTKTPSFDFNGYRGQDERKQVLRAAAAAKSIVYGETIASGVMVFAEEEKGDQVKGEWLHMVLVIAGHPMTRIGEIWLGDEDGNSFGDNVTHEFHSNRTTPDPFLIKNCPSWKPDMIGKGVSYLRISFKFDPEKFPAGLPNVRLRKYGKQIYDPRSKKTEYSNNAALVILDYLRVYLKRSDDQILWDQFITAANICDETVLNTDKTESKRYRINGEFEVNEAPAKILDAMLEACGGELTYIGGKHGLLVGAYYGPATMILDESCIAGDIKIVPETSYKERTNTITGTFIDPGQNYSEVDFPTVSVKEWVDKDGIEITQDIKYRFVTDGFQAQRLANITLRRKRIGRTIEAPLNMRGYKFRPGMYVKVRIKALGINDVEMRVTKWSFDPKGGISVVLRQDFAEMWDDAIGKPIQRPDLTDLPTGGVAQPQNLQYQVMEISDIVQGILQWSNSGMVSYNRVIVRQNGVTVWTAQVPGQSVRVTGLLRGAYTAHVIAVAYNGAVSPEAYLQFNIQAPPAPTSVEVKQGYFAITLLPNIAQITNVSTQFDFWTSGETDLATTATNVIETKATRKGMGIQWTSEGLQNDHTYYWYVRSINAFGTSNFIRVAARCYTSATELMPQIDTEFKKTDTYKNLVSQIGTVADGFTTVRQELADQDKKLTGQIDTVQSSVTVVDKKLGTESTRLDGKINGVDGKVNATNGNVSTLSATVQEQKSTLATLKGQVSAQWGMKVQVDSKGQKYTAGMQLGVEGQGGAIQSYFMVSANNFAIYNPNDSGAELVFAAKAGSVFLKSTFIENGSIDNAKIGNYIQSANYVANSTGWKLDKNGNIEINGKTGTGRLTITNNLIQIYDASGRLRVRMGLW